MKKIFFPTLVALVGFSVGVAVCYFHFASARHIEIPPPVKSAPPATTRTAVDSGLLGTNAFAAFDWKPHTFSFPQPETSAPQAPARPAWPNFAVPMPQPPVDPSGGDWRPDIIIPTIPPQFQGEPHLIPLNSQAQLLLPTFPPKTLEHNFVDAR